jgi:hypothetical protein
VPGELGDQFRAAWALLTLEPAVVRQLLPKGTEAEIGRFLGHARAWLHSLEHGGR